MGSKYEKVVIPDSVIRSLTGRMAYKRGERTEQLTVELLRRDGWFASRTRKGPVDVIAGKDSRVLLVQVKSGGAGISRQGLTQLVNWGKAFNADSEVWFFRGRGRVVKRRVFAAPRLSSSLSRSSSD